MRTIILALLTSLPLMAAVTPEKLRTEHLENPLAQEILAGRYAAGDVIRVDEKDGKVSFS